MCTENVFDFSKEDVECVTGPHWLQVWLVLVSQWDAQRFNDFLDCIFRRFALSRTLYPFRVAVVVVGYR